jgi:putative transposase
VKTVQAYRYALDPNAAAAKALYAHCSAARFAYNHMLALVKAVADQREAERSYGVSEADLTPALNWSAYGLRKVWNQRKDDVCVDRDTGKIWWPNHSKEAYATGCANLATALKNWNDSRCGKRKGPTVGFPRFKRKRDGKPGSVRFTTGTIRLDGRTHVVLPVIGRIKTHESTRKLARRIQEGTGRILSAAVTMERGRWFVVFTCEIDRADPAPKHPDKAVGVDLGVKTLAVTSDGACHPNPRHLGKALGALRRQSRRCSRRQQPDRKARFGGSNRWRRADRARNRTHHRVTDARRDGLHKLTSHLAAGYDAIGVEDLHIAGMLRNRRLARAIADCGFGELLRQLGYKTAWRGTVFAVADRWYPSSKTCSSCKGRENQTVVVGTDIHLRALRPGRRS